MAEKDFQGEFEAYLGLLETPKVNSLHELIEFNKNHADMELPPGMGKYSFSFLYFH
jgi:amidase